MSEDLFTGSSVGQQLADGQQGVDLNFRLLAETIPHFVWSARADGISDYYNARFLNYLGRSLEEMEGWTWAETLHPDDRQASIDAWTEAFNKGTEFCIEYRIRRGADGRYFWYEGRAMPLRDSEGNIVRWFGTCTDIDERKQATTQLEHYGKLFRCVSDIVVVADDNGYFREVNPAFSRTLGYSAEELMSKPLIEFIHPDDRLATLDELARQSRGQFDTLNFENRYVCKDGSSRLFSWNAYYEADGKLFFGIARDITERKRYEEALGKAKDAAEAANRAKSEFLANMSHEIRTPMTAIVAATQLLQSHGVSEGLKKYLEIILTSSESLLAIIDDILDLSKIEAGKVELARATFSLRETIRDAVNTHITVARIKGITIKTDILSEVPDDLVGDKLRLKQILLNLVGNAVKFTNRGSVTISVTMLERRSDTALLRFDVTDTGIGIKPESMEKIFAPFSQEDSSSTRKFGGTGLGLAICTRLVNLMGGKIWAESTEGKGSIFHVHVPLAVADVPTEPLDRCLDEHLVWEGPSLRILLVEDVDSVRMLFEAYLRTISHQVDAARNGAEALEKWGQADYDVILMDIQMPDIDGSKVVKIIREREREHGGHIPIIALTAHAMHGDREKFLGQGFDGYVAKPPKFKKLVEEIRRCLSVKS